MTADEIQQTWVQPCDKEATRSVVQSTLFLMKTGVASHLTDADFVCQRGLEAFCNDERTTRISQSVRTTLAMQRVLKRVGPPYHKLPELIAKAYGKCTRTSRSLALRKAKVDRRAILMGTAASTIASCGAVASEESQGSTEDATR